MCVCVTLVCVCVHVCVVHVCVCVCVCVFFFLCVSCYLLCVSVLRVTKEINTQVGMSAVTSRFGARNTLTTEERLREAVRKNDVTMTSRLLSINSLPLSPPPHTLSLSL